VTVPQVPRLPLRVLALSTALALGAAVGTYALLHDRETTVTAGEEIQLTPEPDPAAADGAVFTTFDGADVPLASLQGAPVLINFFASTCVPCITEMPDFEAVHQELGDQVTFLGLAMQDRPEDARALIERTGVTYRTAQDKEASVFTALGGTVLPTTVLLDADGTILATHNGQLDADELRGMLADELGIDP
jgi:cytochrome c biogenesis protein CcmG/thiol:disulfide interchange protein DsbE